MGGLKMKTLKVKDKDLCVYGDYLNQSAADEFVSGSYTHIQHIEDSSIAEAEITGQMTAGWPMVLIGEVVN
tara:strand:+ start:2527 stop:2739 length:213 start_codon:yes stop_codon:yes gene_type:complete